MRTKKPFKASFHIWVSMENNVSMCIDLSLCDIKFFVLTYISSPMNLLYVFLMDTLKI
jgi:hypothetical protein